MAVMGVVVVGAVNVGWRRPYGVVVTMVAVDIIVVEEMVGMVMAVMDASVGGDDVPLVN